MLGILLKNRLRVLKNSFLKGSAKIKIVFVFIAIMSLSFVAFSYSVSLAISAALKLSNQLEIYEMLLVLAAAGTFIALLFLTITTDITSLYSSTSDLSFLMAVPIRTRTVFTAKFLEIYLANAAAVLLFGYPALIAYGNVTGAPLLYYLLTLFSILILALLPTGVGAILVVFLMRIIPAYRAKEIMGALGALLGAAIWTVSQLLRQSPNSGPGASPLAGKEDQLLATLSIVKGFWANLLPTTWVARSVSFFAKGDFSSGLLLMAGFTVLSLVVLFLALILVEKFFYYGWSRATEVKPVKRKNNVKRQEKGFNLLPVAVRAVVQKDFKLIVRNLQELVQMIFPLIVIVVISLQIKNGMNTGINNVKPEEARFLQYFLLGFILFFLGTFNMRLSIGAFGRERDNIWIILTSGTNPVRIMWGKFLVAYIPSIVTAFLVMMAMALFGGIGLGTILIYLVIILIVSAAFSATGLFLGAIYPRFDGKNPQQVFTFFGGIIGSIINLFITALFLGIFALVQLLSLLGLNSLVVDVLSVIVLGVVVFAFVMGMISLASGRLKKMEY